MISGNGEVGRQNGHREGSSGGVSNEENGESGQTNSRKRRSSHDVELGADQIGELVNVPIVSDPSFPLGNSPRGW